MHAKSLHVKFNAYHKQIISACQTNTNRHTHTS